MTPEAWLGFMSVWIAVSLPLGPNALACMAAAAQHGFSRSLWSVAGIFLAACFYMSLAVSGVAAFLATYPHVFEVIRWAGVIYLGWMGLTLLRSPGNASALPAPAAVSSRALLRRGALISLSNPKALFVWLAVFTQFISPGAPLGPQLMVLGPSALSVTVVVYVGYCAVGRGAGQLLVHRRRKWFDRGAGATYLFFATGLALADLRRT